MHKHDQPRLSPRGASVYAMCRVAVMAALYLPLARMAIEIGTLKLSFGSLPVTVLAMVAAAAIGEFLKQLLSYGFTATTLLWVIPPVLRGLLIGLAASRLARTGRRLEERTAVCYAVGVGAALVTTLVNSLILWADSVLYGYYFPGYVLGNLALRLAVGVITAVLVAMVSMPMVKLLRRQVAVRRA